MKQTIYQLLGVLIALIFSTGHAWAQKKDTTEFNIDNVRIVITEKGDTIKSDKKDSKGMRISIGNNGIKIGRPNLTQKKKKHKKLHKGMHFDFGINNVIDNSVYNGTLEDLVVNNGDITTTASNARDVKKEDFNLRNGRSINFNFWPVWLKQDIAKHNVQLETGLGFQFFNYQYSTNVIHSDAVPTNSAIPPPLASSLRSGFMDIQDPSLLQGKDKNKLGVSYISVPLMLRFNSNKKNGHRYFVGGGVIGSYKLKSWTKFYGVKNSGDFGINDWMLQATAEIGVTGIIKLYGTLGLQSMYEVPNGQNTGLDRRPFAIGIRL